jgi:epoxyqueuosine reductase QueG
MGALEQPHVLDLNNCLSYLLQVDDLPEKAQKVSENRVGDCEICQDVCSWNLKHIKNPLATKMTEEFKTKIKNLEEIYHLANLVKMSEAEYKDAFGYLRTTIPYETFHRNVLLAIKNSKTTGD